MSEARYLYCIADSSEELNLGKIGIDESQVYTIPYQDMSAVVHNCNAEPYKSEQKEQIKAWIISHQKVVDTASEKFGTVLPTSFDTIIKGDQGKSPEENMKDWLKDNHENLKQKMDKVKGRAEYGVQIFWEPKLIGEKLTNENEEIQRINQQIKKKGAGAAYLYRQKIENILKKEVEKKADAIFKGFYERIKIGVDDIRVEKTKSTSGGEMLMNLSCLANKFQAKNLGVALEEINKLKGFSVRFTGPWPPYSFVSPG